MESAMNCLAYEMRDANELSVPCLTNTLILIKIASWV